MEENKRMCEFDKNVDFIPVSMYDTENGASNGGVIMTSKEVLSAISKELNLSQAEIARRSGMTPVQLSARITRNSIRADEFLSMLDAVGVDVKMVVRESGRELKTNTSGAGRRVRGMVDKVIYDTAASDALANNFYADGVNEYSDGRASELYVDKEGRYFFAEYTSWEGGKDRILPVPAAEAAAFIEKYGTELHKAPKETE